MSADTTMEWYQNDEEDKNLPFTRRKIPNENLTHRIMQLQIQKSRRDNHLGKTHKLYQCIFPNLTIADVDYPQVYGRKFSPDGRHLVSFSMDLKTLVIYKYNGAASAEHLLTKIDPNIDLINQNYGDSYDNLRMALFNAFFTKKFEITLVKDRGGLNRECSVFSTDSRYVIVCHHCTHSQMYATQCFRENFYQNNETLAPSSRTPVGEYNFEVVDLYSGTRTFSLKFDSERIPIAHQQGIYLYRNKLGIICLQHQKILLYHFENGVLTECDQIGVETPSEHADIEAFESPYFGSTRQAIFTFLAERGKTIAENANDPFENIKMLGTSQCLSKMKLWRFQFLDDDKLFIKFIHEDVVSARVVDNVMRFAVFAVYSISARRILYMFDGASSTLLKAFEENCDDFRNAELNGKEVLYPSSMACCIDSRMNYLRQKASSATDERESNKRYLGQIPMPCQNFSYSPYLDAKLFSYDEQFISNFERPKPVSSASLNFLSRPSLLKKFQIKTGPEPDQNSANEKKLVAFNFHPYEPFAMSLQRCGVNFVLNFHIRHNARERDVS